MPDAYGAPSPRIATIRSQVQVGVARCCDSSWPGFQDLMPVSWVSTAGVRSRRSAALAPAVLTQLTGIRFLETGPGAVTAPGDAYLLV